MTHELQALTRRLETLEAQNRKVKRLGALAIGAGLFLGTAGFVAPAICDVVTGERLVLHDSRGKTRVTIDAYQVDVPTLAFHTKDGRVVGKFGVDANGEAFITLLDHEGKTRATHRFGVDPENATPGGPAKRDDRVGMAR